MKPQADNCPTCLNGPNLPHTTRSDGVSLVGAYRCVVCGETWTCSWRVDALEQEEAGHDAA